MKTFSEFVIGTLQKAAWAPLSVFVVHVIMTKGFNAYDHYPVLDIPMHFLGGVVICYFYLEATHAPNADLYLGRHTKFSRFILLMALTGTTTVLWEFAEWIADHYFGETAQLSVTDTMGDMLLGLMGGLVVSSVASFNSKT